MQTTHWLAGLLTIAWGASAASAETMSSDPLTKLPLPAPETPFSLYENPDKINDVPVCKSKGTMDFYTGRNGTVSAAVAWYSTHLTGFKHVHGMGSGRSQDTFYNASGTLIVGITGMPGAAGQDTKVYSVVYGTIQPGVSEKVIAGMNVQHEVCSS